ncbi:PREDICTED: olfactory receptor 6C65-like [Branchiostoma belcheri]|uniref:Olfactory receptor 6C65-like n=1 Tax=Branchiostoma belcheri TaxID=7741 RepID=A0A6P5AHD0_BRABE|nr:PREDICTED: olfactory receptor 6C65-like [Branchiostoma belcheri]
MKQLPSLGSILSNFSHNLGEIHEIISNTPLSRGLQTAYLVISLVIAAGCNLLLIFLVWKTELLRKPRHYLRCNLALEDIIFTGCMIPSVIYLLFSDYVSISRHLTCVEPLVVPMSTVSMFGTYLLMAIELYYFICHPLHYGTNVTTKRVFIGIVSVRAFALFFGVGPTVIKRLQNSDDSLLCQLEPFNSTNPAAIFRNICGLSVVFAVLAILIIYYIVYKEARKQQERDEQRHLWLCQIKAFRKLAPHIVVLAVSVASYLFLVASGRAVLNGGEKVSTSRLITVVVANRIFLTVSSMVNPIIYSFRQPEFRRALRELCGLSNSNNIPLVPPPPPPVHRGQGVAVINFPVHHDEETSDEALTAASLSQNANGQHGEQAPPSSPDQIQAETEGQQAEHGEQAPPLSPDLTQAKTRGQQTEVHDERAPGHCEAEAVLTVQADVHLNPTPPTTAERSGLPKSAPPQQHGRKMTVETFPPEPKSQKDEDVIDVCGKKETVITRERVRKLAWHDCHESKV